jgi:hypothetical protein
VPAAIARIKARRAELDAAFQRENISEDQARAEHRRFTSDLIAHVREHGSEPR